MYVPQDVPYASVVSCEFAFVITEMYFVTAAKPVCRGQGACDRCDVCHGPIPPISITYYGVLFPVSRKGVYAQLVRSKYDDI